MPKIALKIKATLENLTKLKPDGEDFRWYLKLQCQSCGEATGNFQYLAQDECSELKGTRSSANLVSKCKLCHRENSINILPETIKSYDADDSERFKAIIAFDCRGYMPLEFQPSIGWKAEGVESATKFDVDLSEKEWADYDEKAKCSVGIYEFDQKFEKVYHNYLLVLLLACSVANGRVVKTENGNACSANADCKSDNCVYYSYGSVKRVPIFKCQPAFDPKNPIVYAIVNAQNGASCSQDYECASDNCVLISFDSTKNVPIFQCEPPFDQNNPIVYAVQPLENFQPCTQDSDCLSNNCGFYSIDSDNLKVIFKCEPPFDPNNPIVYAKALTPKLKTGSVCLVNDQCKSGNCGFYGWNEIKNIPILQCKKRHDHRLY